ncbi:hypothetical protein BCR33DRAFT_712363 [Rhizoclosmatium globosum]|uniref:CCHC-type domain-containing protein n=1 Tax=Rhizoclosmatium globosum TaxID=329046 RepID=A0A1Y2CY46_9FUNG|nr:hypothetical protein BCR33DRAFT_712363 [Rhizoclosmatium globosum]|eukprot:ORY51255.1 hypothetical protein BCR33DRAFT_712363 [Rhizoclosmatium globosum]
MATTTRTMKTRSMKQQQTASTENEIIDLMNRMAIAETRSAKKTQRAREKLVREMPQKLELGEAFEIHIRHRDESDVLYILTDGRVLYRDFSEERSILRPFLYQAAYHSLKSDGSIMQFFKDEQQEIQYLEENYSDVAWNKLIVCLQNFKKHLGISHYRWTQPKYGLMEYLSMMGVVYDHEVVSTPMETTPSKVSGSRSRKTDFLDEIDVALEPFTSSKQSSPTKSMLAIANLSPEKQKALALDIAKGQLIATVNNEPDEEETSSTDGHSSEDNSRNSKRNYSSKKLPPRDSDDDDSSDPEGSGSSNNSSSDSDNLSSESEVAPLKGPSSPRKAGGISKKEESQNAMTHSFNVMSSQSLIKGLQEQQPPLTDKASAQVWLEKAEMAKRMLSHVFVDDNAFVRGFLNGTKFDGSIGRQVQLILSQTKPGLNLWKSIKDFLKKTAESPFSDETRKNNFIKDFRLKTVNATEIGCEIDLAHITLNVTLSNKDKKQALYNGLSAEYQAQKSHRIMKAFTSLQNHKFKVVTKEGKSKKVIEKCKWNDKKVSFDDLIGYLDKTEGWGYDFALMNDHYLSGVSKTQDSTVQKERTQFPSKVEAPFQQSRTSVQPTAPVQQQRRIIPRMPTPYHQTHIVQMGYGDPDALGVPPNIFETHLLSIAQTYYSIELEPYGYEPYTQAELESYVQSYVDNVKCYGCGEIGHFRRNCPNAQKNNNSPSGRSAYGQGIQPTGTTPHQRAGSNRVGTSSQGDVA